MRHRLNDYVKELEEKLRKLQPDETRKENVEVETIKSQSPGRRSLKHDRAPAVPTYLDPLAELGVNKKYYNWDVVSIRKPQTHQQTYGTSSSFYYINQMTVYMNAVLREKLNHARLDTVYKPYHAGPDGDALHSSHDGSHLTASKDGFDLSRFAEETYLSGFWTDFDNVALIVSRDEFERRFDSLWQSFRALRLPSALVDVILALCMQRSAQISSTNLKHHGLQNPEVAGLWWHRRSQRLLVDDLEEPSIATFQCHLLSVMWLSNAGLHNTAHSVMASGIRVGIILGLHLETPETLSLEHREFRKRLWWTTYALEMKFAMDLGRPIAVNCKQVTCCLPSEKAPIPDSAKSALSYNIHLIKLLLAGRAVYITFYRRCAEELDSSGKETIYEDLAVLEECAKFLASNIIYLRTWAKHVPSALQTIPGKAFSVDDIKLDFSDSEIYIPLRRQSILLELHYHTMAMNLFRPFIAFSTSQRPAMPNTQTHALSCAKHAAAITSILEQTCTKSNYLDGMLEVWQWQWSAALSLVGYILAYPHNPVSPSVRRSIDTAISILRTCSKDVAAEVIHELVAKADALHPGVQHSCETVDSTNLAEQGTQSLETLVSGGLGWDFGDDFHNVAEGLDDLSGGSSVMCGAGSSFALEGLDCGDQSMFDLLDFEGVDNLEQ
ncbi:uncharacterized protein N0V89_003531 [Didymosphaeria variabile]|uniref:Xylanolytic transcriptional activator regulatory domain-containing protein n=1 Tax=Didymosphaeria variabile TaxID=1932322 RepID=A0A9W8XNK8_9PLEO|nr:uncharacterized protein N0V89_003531 [Didymosphaeria variabile]KAJ4355514.1 hypothetical protein N0V89_003531 [Didymosphaeria variabile]